MDMDNEKFEELYDKVKPIVTKLERTYQIRIWLHDDWEQEAMISLYHLCQSCPQVLCDEHCLRIYFKTKFSNYVKDVLRKQCSVKRQFNQMIYEEIGEVGHAVRAEGLLLEDYVSFKSWLEVIRENLSVKEQAQLDRLIRGERFAGRKALLKQLKERLVEE
ncbi:sigma-70 family RNA polymerase sigma factor [Streptococcus sp. sy004]|uniref:sigma-70 family RNA polymerase sigma factor n=1 Tax=Streptococcus sp. sy004 TaxID=2600149 RepID=UPI0021BD30A4|nr:sigma-70 family RNA polymerase sigma factor [Streptococcus sp. sy004]